MVKNAWEGLRQRAATAMQSVKRAAGLAPDEEKLRRLIERASAVEAMTRSGGWQALLEDVKARRDSALSALVYGKIQDAHVLRAKVQELDWLLLWAAGVAEQGRKSAGELKHD